ncbi:MAG: hypothetical protein WC498_03285 [Candidatus Saccharimonadales bacterium]
MDANPKQQLAERLKQANNVLVTVSANPSVDQLSACIGLTLVLNHMGKHATAVFSGEVPSTIEFLKPEETLERTTDSLRDFIIALDKSKADKLRYKVEDQVVRIFITPYRTSISQDDLEFSQGDFNVDVVVALGVHQQSELDQAITAHGRILHDATVATINTNKNGDLGSLNWVDTSASSLSELVVSLTDVLDKGAYDTQTATALLTGIVAATERFSNDKTSPKTMSASAELMAAGANQQLIATQLEEPEVPVVPKQSNDGGRSADGNTAAAKKDPGELDIDHESRKKAPEPVQEVPDEPAESKQPQVHVDENGQLTTLGDGSSEPEISTVRGVSSEGDITESASSTNDEPANDSRERVLSPPERGGKLTANIDEEDLDPGTEALTLPAVDTPVLSHNQSGFSAMPNDFSAPEPKASDSSAVPITPDETLTEIEQAVESPHALDPSEIAAPNVNEARDAVEAALNDSVSKPLEPITSLNAQPLGNDLRGSTPPTGQPTGALNAGFNEPTPGSTPADRSLDMPLPSNQFPNQQPQSPSTFPGAPQPGTDTLPPAPPVPPPMLPPM